MPSQLAIYLLGINVAAFGTFGWDKFCAERDMYRVPERTLLTLAAIGGAFGAVFGQQTFRHKTRKEPFRTYLNFIAVFNVVGLAALGLPSACHRYAMHSLTHCFSRLLAATSMCRDKQTDCEVRGEAHNPFHAN